MIVPQGKSAGEWMHCCETILRYYWNYYWIAYESQDQRALQEQGPVIAIPRHTADYDGGRMLLADWLKDLRTIRSFDVHLLGWERDLWAIWDIAREHPWIRSIDSAKPFHYALEGKRLPMPGEDYPSYEGRDYIYFDRHLTAQQRQDAWHNAVMFETAARGGQP